MGFYSMEEGLMRIKTSLCVDYKIEHAKERLTKMTTYFGGKAG